MPLEVGQKWAYHVDSPFHQYIEDVRVVRRAAVGDVSGFELEGAMGSARLAWRDKKLIAERLGSSRFDPPIPLLLPGAKSSAVWRGKVQNLEGASDVEAALNQEPEVLSVSGQSVHCTKTVLKLELHGHKMELVTWFAPGTGILRQEQRTDDRQNLAIDQLTGP